MYSYRLKLYKYVFSSFDSPQQNFFLIALIKIFSLKMLITSLMTNFLSLLCMGVLLSIAYTMFYKNNLSLLLRIS